MRQIVDYKLFIDFHTIRCFMRINKSRHICHIYASLAVYFSPVFSSLLILIIRNIKKDRVNGLVFNKQKVGLFNRENLTSQPSMSSSKIPAALPMRAIAIANSTAAGGKLGF